MKKLFTALMALALVASSAYADEKKDTVKFSVVKEIPITSVKDQNQSGTCWCYSTLAFLAKAKELSIFANLLWYITQ